MKTFAERFWDIAYSVCSLAILISSAYGLSCYFGKYSTPIGLVLLFVFLYASSQIKKQKQNQTAEYVTELLNKSEYDNVTVWAKYEIIKAIKKD